MLIVAVLLLFAASLNNVLWLIYAFYLLLFPYPFPFWAMFDVKCRNFSRYWYYYNKRLNIYHLSVCRNDSWISDCVCVYFCLRAYFLSGLLLGWLVGSFVCWCVCVAPRALFVTARWKRTDIIFSTNGIQQTIASAHKCRLVMQILFMKSGHKKFNESV